MKAPMTLGEIIATLKRKDPTLTVSFDFVHFKPKGIDSYRGDYAQLAIGYGYEDITVAELLKLCEEAVGKDFEGYKGGTYTMGESTPVWVANRGESGGTAVVDIETQSWRVVLVTASVD